MKTLKLDLGPRSYSIFIGEGLLRRADLFDAAVAGDQPATHSHRKSGLRRGIARGSLST